MKKTFLILSSISIFLGAAYAAWAYTPIGRNVIAKWLLKKWEAMAKREQKKFDKKTVATELAKLNYLDHVLLFKYTRIDLFEKERTGKLKGKVKENIEAFLKQMNTTRLLKRANLSTLENFVLPG